MKYKPSNTEIELVKACFENLLMQGYDSNDQDMLVANITSLTELEPKYIIDIIGCNFIYSVSSESEYDEDLFLQDLIDNGYFDDKWESFHNINDPISSNNSWGNLNNNANADQPPAKEAEKPKEVKEEKYIPSTQELCIVSKKFSEVMSAYFEGDYGLMKESSQLAIELVAEATGVTKELVEDMYNHEFMY